MEMLNIFIVSDQGATWEPSETRSLLICKQDVCAVVFVWKQSHSHTSDFTVEALTQSIE